VGVVDVNNGHGEVTNTLSPGKAGQGRPANQTCFEYISTAHGFSSSKLPTTFYNCPRSCLHQAKSVETLSPISAGPQICGIGLVGSPNMLYFAVLSATQENL
jgi:hypothetical protein